MDFLARVTPRYFAGVQLCSAKADIRYYLNGVCIERHPKQGVIIIATNGHIMAAMHDPDGWLADGHQSLIVGSISNRLISACKVKRGPDGEPPQALWIASKYSVVTGFGDPDQPPEAFSAGAQLTEKVELIDAKFPDWRRVMPVQSAEDGKPYPLVNGGYLETFNRVAETLSGQKRFAGGGTHLAPAGDKEAVIVRMPSHELVDRFVGVIMNMRGDPLKSVVPSWVSAQSAA